MTENNQGCGKEFRFNGYTWICGKGMKGANLKDTYPPLCPKCKEQQNQTRETKDVFSQNISKSPETPQGLDEIEEIKEKICQTIIQELMDDFERQKKLTKERFSGYAVNRAIELTLAHCEDKDISEINLSQHLADAFARGRTQGRQEVEKEHNANNKLILEQAKEEAEDKFEKIKELGKHCYAESEFYEKLDKIKEGKA